MSFFATPRNLVESFWVALGLFRITGLFPFRFNEVENRLQLSWKLFLITVFHLLVYSYVNITSLMENWYDYSQPMIGHSALTILGNLNLRFLDMITTFAIFLPLLVASPLYVSALNIYLKIFNELVLMGIDVKSIYRRLYYQSFVLMLYWIVSMAFAAWHSIFFFELITKRPPELKYYLVVTLSRFYKLLFIFYGNSQLFVLYMISHKINCYIDNLIEVHKVNFNNKLREQKKLAKQKI